MADSPDRYVLIQGSLWWNFERFCRIHGYVLTDITGTPIVYLHKPGADVPDLPATGQD